MQSWKKTFNIFVVTALLLGCQAGSDGLPGALDIRTARLVAVSEGSVLELGMDCRLSESMRDALEHGIPITLVVHLAARAAAIRLDHARHLELRYFPLSRRYQLRDDANAAVHSFASSGYLIDALGALRLPLPDEFSSLPDGTALTLKVELDRSALPGALRLPAVLQSSWRLAAAEYAWTVAG